MEIESKLASSNLESTILTHARLKQIASSAQSTEDHISRLALALSLASGPIELDWEPERMSAETDLFSVITGKQIRGKTLFKDDLPIWMALALQYHRPDGYSEWRKLMVCHWERGVQILAERSIAEGDWIRTLRACLPN